MIATPAWIELIPLKTVDSTNTYASILAQSGQAPGGCVWALQQTAGRGRHGRSWESPPGNLYCSMIIPQTDLNALAQLSFVTSLAAAQTLNSFLSRPRCQTKWPNDVVVETRKIAGVLIETVPQRPCCILGIGINVLTRTAGQKPCTTLCDLTPDPIDVPYVLERFLAVFDHWYHRWQIHGFNTIRPLWLENAFLWNQQITMQVQTTHATLKGKFETIADDGTLGLRSLDGQRIDWIRLAEMVLPESTECY